MPGVEAVGAFSRNANLWLAGGWFQSNMVADAFSGGRVFASGGRSVGARN
jgi:hypothetical protein